MTEQEIKSRISELEKELKDLKEKLRNTKGNNGTFTEQTKTIWMTYVKLKYKDYRGHSLYYYWWPRIRMEACAAATNGRTQRVTDLKGDEIQTAVDIAQKKVDDLLKKMGLK